MSNLDTFVEVFARHLNTAVLQYPHLYRYGVDKVPEVVSRMREGFVHGTYNKDSHAIKAACKELNVKHTYKAIGAYLSAGDNVG